MTSISWSVASPSWCAPCPWLLLTMKPKRKARLNQKTLAFESRPVFQIRHPIAWTIRSKSGFSILSYPNRNGAPPYVLSTIHFHSARKGLIGAIWTSTTWSISILQGTNPGIPSAVMRVTDHQAHTVAIPIEHVRHETQAIRQNHFSHKWQRGVSETRILDTFKWVLWRGQLTSASSDQQ